MPADAERGPATGSAPDVEIPAPVLDAIAATCADSGEAERCGALFGTTDPPRVERAVPVENAAPDPGRAYAIPAARVRTLQCDAADLGLDVVGFYHSHPTGPATPSAADLAGAWPGYLYVIVAGAGAATRVRAWRLAEDRRGFDETRIRTGTTR